MINRDRGDGSLGVAAHEPLVAACPPADRVTLTACH